MLPWVKNIIKPISQAILSSHLAPIYRNRAPRLILAIIKKSTLISIHIQACLPMADRPMAASNFSLNLPGRPLPEQPLAACLN
ncbi:hypothetical protein Ppro_0032 [Pelobacter propionicus DSM 2379]|uniref:Uncharacterized protein n=1 Tax=Pelobacter propionicus (strain DSM 2379 / NBRC 103807 / OttBd1) TaxID=338966 RepID=A1AK02_PELPD|nr:hypothetical protein Ppro_0032 [Pelobacter propionicus DSM 2379]